MQGLARPYSFTIQDLGEYNALCWLAARYTYAEVIVKVIAQAPEDINLDDDSFPLTFTFTEPDAWAIQEAIEAEDGYLTCMGARLREEVEKLLGAIV